MHTEVRLRRCAAALLAGVLAGCGNDAPSAPPVPANVVAISATTQTAAVGTAVAAAPAVRVTDADGDPVRGVAVSFATTGGSVQAAVDTTDAQGEASAGQWMLGTAAGTQRATATVPGVATPAEFTATATAGAPAAASAVGGIGQTGVVANALTDSLAVRVNDSHGNPVPGATVAFAVTVGGGAVSAPTAQTGAEGIARVRWTLGSRPGANAVTATVGTLTVPFSATGTFGPPGGISWESTLQTARVGTAVARAPSITVRDSYGNELPGIAVTWTVVQGGGTVQGAAAVTNAAGVAAVTSWTLGAAPGENLLRATVAGLTTAAEFRATATDPCAPVAAYPTGTAFIDGRLATTDCRLASGEYVDTYSLATNAGGIRGLYVETARLIGPSPKLTLLDASGTPRGADSTVAGQFLSMFVVLPAGSTYRAGAGLLNGVLDEYRISSVSPPTGPSCGRAIWLLNGSVTTRSLGAGACGGSTTAGAFYYERYNVQLRAGETLTVTHRSTAFNARLRVTSRTGSLVAQDEDGAGGTDARVTYTAAVAGVYTVEAATATAGATGAYTISATVQ